MQSELHVTQDILLLLVKHLHILWQLLLILKVLRCFDVLVLLQ